jgi:hypothetical protein
MISLTRPLRRRVQLTADRESLFGRLVVVLGGLSYRTARYFFISQSVSWTRYSSHSFRFSSM